MNQETMIQRAVKAVGTQRNLAEKLAVKQQAVQIWVSQNRIPVRRVIDIARATGWAVTPHQLAPRIYPHADDGLPEFMRKGRE